MKKENSFDRLHYINHFLLLVSEYQIQRVIQILLLWSPEKLSFLSKNGLIYILVSPLNSYQLLTLMENNIPIYYLNENKNFIPWNYCYYESEEPFTIIFINKKKDKLEIEKFKDYESFVKFTMPKYLIMKGHKKSIMSIKLKIKKGGEETPDYFLIEAKYFEKLLILFNFHLPFINNNYDKTEFIFLNIKKSNYFLIKTGKELNESQLNVLDNISYKTFYILEQGYINVETGLILTPLINKEFIIEKIKQYEAFIYKDKEEISSIFLSAEQRYFKKIDELTDYFTLIYDNELDKFLMNHE
jgi:hypothetical protein